MWDLSVHLMDTSIYGLTTGHNLTDLTASGMKTKTCPSGNNRVALQSHFAALAAGATSSPGLQRRALAAHPADQSSGHRIIRLSRFWTSSPASRSIMTIPLTYQGSSRA